MQRHFTGLEAGSGFGDMKSTNLLFEELMAAFDNPLESAAMLLVTVPELKLNRWTVIAGIP